MQTSSVSRLSAAHGCVCRSFLTVGKGNADSWNSCSHGAGRAMSRTRAKAVIKQVSLDSLIRLRASGALLEPLHCLSMMIISYCAPASCCCQLSAEM